MTTTYNQMFIPPHPQNTPIYGKPNKKRTSEPSMFEVLSWPSPLPNKKQHHSPKHQHYSPQPNTQPTNQTIQPLNHQQHKQQPQSKQHPTRCKSQRAIQREQKRKEKLIKFKQASRQLPNSSFLTYFGKPPFENYGNANINPTTGGLLYGNYLFTHNVYPHRGANVPSNLQCYPQALKIAKEKGPVIPIIPRNKFMENQQSQKNNEQNKPESMSIYPTCNHTQNLKIESPSLDHRNQRYQSSQSNKIINQQFKQEPKNTIAKVIQNQSSLKKKSKYKKQKSKQNNKDNYDEWIKLKDNKKQTGSTTHQDSSHLNRIQGKKVQY